MLSGFRRIVRSMITLRAARIMANRISHCAPGPAPKTMGIGPMKMIPPKLDEPPCENAAAAATSIRPTMVIENPMINRMSRFGGVFC